MDFIPNTYLISLTKQLRQSILSKDTNTSEVAGAQTHGLVIHVLHCSNGPHILPINPTF